MEKYKHTILIVDDAPDNLEILDGVLNEDYYIKVARSGKIALKIAEQTCPDLILLDIMMPEMDGYEVCKRLKCNPITKKIPIIFVSARNEVINEARGLEIGAVDYITKPINASIVLSRVRTHIALYNQKRELELQVLEKTRELIDTRVEIIRRLGIAAEFKDNVTGMHIYRVSHYCKTIALKYGFPESEANLLLDISPMHDIGKIGISDNLLLKPGKLTEEEFEIIKTHTLIGARIIGEHSSELLKTAKVIALEHHERWDGTGYPNGLKGEEINIFARITAVADVFDALTSKRPYKDAWTIHEASDYLKSQAGKHFDPNIITAFFFGLEDILKIKEKYSEE
ncbi:MAG: two-component system response regulator [Firmicutes bacterium HGW-Firmicutes-1]|jgi:putative two-component system response regulator|nr:MAG: two-component system response regulator [Firmicutes bacterium HGW-Firmicutes-1]